MAPSGWSATRVVVESCRDLAGPAVRPAVPFFRGRQACPKPGRLTRLSEDAGTVDRSSNWCSIIDSPSPAGRTCVLIIGMAQVMPAAGFRPTQNRPGGPDWPARSRPLTAAPTDGGILRHDYPRRQSPAEAGWLDQRHERSAGSAGPPGIQGHCPDGRARTGRAATTTRVCPPGTGHTPEEEQ